MNGLTLLTIATLVAFALSARWLYLDLQRERRRNARLRARIDELLDVLDEDVITITRLRQQHAMDRHPSNVRVLRVIDGGAS